MSRRQINWTGVTFTPSSGTTINFDGVTAITWDTSANTIEFSGDGDKFVSGLATVMQSRSVSITCANLAVVSAMIAGQTGTLVAIHNDAYAGVGTGAMTYTLNNAKLGKRSLSGNHKQYGSAALSLEAYAPDGQTDPLTITSAA